MTKKQTFWTLIPLFLAAFLCVQSSFAVGTSNRMRAIALADLNERLPVPGNPFTLEVVDPNERVIDGGTDAGEESSEPGARNPSVAAAAASAASAAAARASMAAGGGGGPVAVSFSPAADDRPAAAIASANAAAAAAAAAAADAAAAAARSAIPVPAVVQTPAPTPAPIVAATTRPSNPTPPPAAVDPNPNPDPDPPATIPCPSDEPCDGVVIPGAPLSVGVGGQQIDNVLSSSKFLSRRSGSKSSLTGAQLLAIRNANLERVCQEYRRRGIHPPECRSLLTPHVHR